MATTHVDLPASLAARAYLLAWDPDRQRLRGTSRLAYLVRAAAVSELYLDGRLRDEGGKVRAAADRSRAERVRRPDAARRPDSPLGAEPTRRPEPARGAEPTRGAEQPRHDVLLTDLHREIAASSKARTWAWWVRRDAKATHRRVRAQLVEGGWIATRSRRVLGIVPVTRVDVRRPEVVAALRARVAAALAAGTSTEVDRSDAALVVLVAAADVGGVLGRRERRAKKARLRALDAQVGPVPGALRKVLRDDELTTMAAG